MINNIRCEKLNELVIRFSGDSGDGIQLAGDQLAKATNSRGNELMTYADFPSEIRPPEGTLSGVSTFQIRMGSSTLFTPGDRTDVLVAFNPAALKTSLPSLKCGGVLVVNEESFTAQGLEKAGYAANPLDGAELADYQLLRIPIVKLTRLALIDSGLSRKEMDRCKNLFALGLIGWLSQGSTEAIENWVKRKFAGNAPILAANLKCLEAGRRYGENGELSAVGLGHRFEIPPAHSGAELAGSLYLSGNAAMAQGLHHAVKQADIRMLMAGYPITPATSLFEGVAAIQDERIHTIQTEDEIAAAGAALGASFAGALGVTCTSGPGLSLMVEFIGLAVMAELPLLVIDVQRAGPSTGLPTKTEQADLLQACYGRHGESPVVVLAPSSPADAYETVMEASRLAIESMTPVIVLSDAYLANAAENLFVSRSRVVLSKAELHLDSENFKPYARNERTLARPWVALGTPGLEHVTGGLEKADVSGEFSQDHDNHDLMTRKRAEKVLRSRQKFTPLNLFGPSEGEILIVGWGSTYGALREAASLAQKDGHSVSHLHLRHLNPFHEELEPLLGNFKRIIVIENNLGQLWMKLRAEFLIPAERFNQVMGRPFRVSEILAHLKSAAGGIR